MNRVLRVLLVTSFATQVLHGVQTKLSYEGDGGCVTSLEDEQIQEEPVVPGAQAGCLRYERLQDTIARTQIQKVGSVVTITKFGAEKYDFLHALPVIYAELSQNQQLLVTITNNNEVFVWDLRIDAKPNSVGIYENVLAAHFSSDNKQVTLVAKDVEFILDLESRKILH